MALPDLRAADPCLLIQIKHLQNNMRRFVSFVSALNINKARILTIQHGKSISSLSSEDPNI